MEFPVIVDLVKKSIMKDLRIKVRSALVTINNQIDIYLLNEKDSEEYSLLIYTCNGGRVEIDITPKQYYQWECLVEELKEYEVNKATRYINSFFDNSKKEVSIDDLDDSEDN